MHNLAFGNAPQRRVLVAALLFCGAVAASACQDTSDPDPSQAADAADDAGTGTVTEGGSDGRGSGDATGGEEDPFDALDQCDEFDFAASPWFGPAFDPETGELVAPLEPPYVVASTVGWAKTDPESLEQLGDVTQRIIENVYAHEGLLGGTFGSSEACGAARTLTLWRDEEAMLEFSFSGPHLEAIPLPSATLQSSGTTHWTETESSAPPTWPAANARIADDRIP